MVSHVQPDEFYNREIPLIVNDDEGGRHLVGRAVLLNREGGFAAYFDKNPDQDGIVKKILDAITSGVISSLTLAPRQAEAPDVERE